MRMHQMSDIKSDDTFATSLAISKYAKVQHHSITRLIRKYKDDFEYFGPVEYDDKRPGFLGGRPQRVYILNKRQTILLLQKMSKRTDVKRVTDLLSLQKEVTIIDRRDENHYFDIIKSIVGGFNAATANKFRLKKEYRVGDYRVDYAIIKSINSKEYPLLLIEYDEHHHRYRIKRDSERKKNIIRILGKKIGNEYCFKLLVLQQGEELENISKIVSLLVSINNEIKVKEEPQ